MGVTTFLAVCLVTGVVGQEGKEDISGCCTHLRIETEGSAGEHQSNRLGDYRVTGVVNDRPIYKKENGDEFLFYLRSKNKGLWMVGPEAGQFNGGLAHRGDKFCVEDVVENQWKYTDGSAWHVDKGLRVSCLDETVTPQCIYSDMTQFEGGDLPQAFGGGGVETDQESSAGCIKECQKRAGCKYWTFVMGEKVNCFLKNNKGDEVRRAKHVSGSIPKACLSTPPSPTVAPATFSSCTFPGLEFQGGSLFPVTANSMSDCRHQCSDHVSCRLFTFLPNEPQKGCLFFTDQARPIQNVGAVSGATVDNCQNFVLPPVESSVKEVAAEETFNENEVNGKFKITSSKWNPTLSDPTSPAFSELANTIEDSLEEMLRNDLGEEAEFTVKVQKFRQGSVVCDFKVNYILKEGYVAIPFAIKPSNITEALGNNFKFKKGVLFQRFLIAANSFNASAPVDHCSLKGCSHKCNYDYDLEDYVCTCPRSLVLDKEGRNCLTEEEAADQDELKEEEEQDVMEDGKGDDVTLDDEEEAVTKDQEEDVLKDDEVEDIEKVEGEDVIKTIDNTERPPIELVVLPMNCLWGPWSGWSGCSTTCGLGTRQRERTILMPAKNGGKCPGAPKEFVACESLPCEEYEVTSTEQVVLGENGTESSTDDKENTTVVIFENDKEPEVIVTEKPALLDYDDTTIEIVTKITVSETADENISKLDSDEDDVLFSDITTASVDTTLLSISTEDSSKEADTILPEESTTEFEISQEITTVSSETLTSSSEETTLPEFDSQESTVSMLDSQDTTTLAIFDEDTTIVRETTIPDLFSEDTTTKYTSTVTGINEETTKEYIDEVIDNVNTESSIVTKDNNEQQTTIEDELSAKSPKVIATTTHGEIFDDDIETEIPDVELSTDMSLKPMDTTEGVNEDIDEASLGSTTIVSSQVEEGTEVESGVIFGDTTASSVTTQEQFKEVVDEDGSVTKIVEVEESVCTTEMGCSSETEVEISETSVVESDILTTTEKIEEIMEESSKPITPRTITVSDDVIFTTQPSFEAEDITTTTSSVVKPTTVSVISVEEDGNDITITTTVRPYIVKESGEEIQEDTTINIKTTTSYHDQSSTTMISSEVTDETTTEALAVEDTSNERERVTEEGEVEKTTEFESEIDGTTESDDIITTTLSEFSHEDTEVITTTHMYDDLDNIVTEKEDDVVTAFTESATDEDIDETTVPAETLPGDHEFSCKEITESSLDTDPDTQIPMKCVLNNVKEDKVRTVFIVLSKDSVDPDRLFAKNVKLVVKDFMIMDLSPK